MHIRHLSDELNVGFQRLMRKLGGALVEAVAMTMIDEVHVGLAHDEAEGKHTDVVIVTTRDGRRMRIHVTLEAIAVAVDPLGHICQQVEMNMVELGADGNLARSWLNGQEE